MATNTQGVHLHDDDAERRREAARDLGSARTPAKIAAAQATAAARKGSRWTEEQKANLRARLAQIKQEKAQQTEGEKAGPA